MRRVAAGALALAMISAIAVGSAAEAATEATSEPLLSQSGQAAIADLRTCLASEDELNVYYLVDSSQSLRVADDGGPGSDPDNLRAPILANSLEELGKLGGEATVSWAAGFFSTEFSARIPWHEWQQGGHDELEAEIEGNPTAGYTNWPAALEGAQAELATRSGCKLLVWLTDGQLDLPPSDGPGDGEQAAFADMCSETGVFNDFRDEGVVVIGALLAATESARAASGEMQRLVEGKNPATGEECGVQPMPDSYVHGAFVDATDPDALRFVFLQLGAQVGGGYPHPFEADGSFMIDPGVSSFRIIASGDWTLHPPGDSELDAATSAEPPAWLSFDGANTIDVGTESPEMHGVWRLESAAARDLFLYSGLSLAFDETTSIVVGESGEPSIALGGNVLTRDGSEADLGDLEYSLSASIVSIDGAPLNAFVPLTDPQVDPDTGAISVMLSQELDARTIVVQASIDQLRTKAHGLDLVPIATREQVEIVSPADYPQVTEVEKISDLEGAEGEAAFTLRVTGPEGGGEICFDHKPEIASDGLDRTATWEWAYPQGCTTVPAEGAEIRVTATNSTPADAEVRAILPVTLRAAQGSDPATYPDQNQNVDLEFRTSHPTNAAAITGLAILFLVLGLLIPLLGLWLLNRLTSALDVDSALQRGSFAVKIQSSGVVFSDAPSSDAALSERFRYLTSAERVRSLEDPDVGRISTVVPWFPLLAPWYRVQPSSGRSIVAARTAARSGSAGEIRSDGSVKFTQLPFDGFWMLVVPTPELGRTQGGDDVNGTVVIYHRASPDGPGQYRARLSFIAADTKLAESVERARSRVVRNSPTPTGKAHTGSAAPRTPEEPTTGGPPPRAAAGSAAGSAPPRLGEVRPGPGGPPPRHAEDGSGAGGSVPPRPSGPPPRPSSR